MFQEIYNQFLPYATNITFMLVFLGFAIFAKVSSGVYKNVFSFSAKFDPKYFGMGALKAILFGLSFYAVALVSAGVPLVLLNAGLLTDKFAIFFAEGTPLVIVSYAIYKLVLDAYKNYKETLHVSDGDMAEMNAIVVEETLNTEEVI